MIFHESLLEKYSVIFIKIPNNLLQLTNFYLYTVSRLESSYILTKEYIYENKFKNTRYIDCMQTSRQHAKTLFKKDK